jgi:hypothetical protein
MFRISLAGSFGSCSSSLLDGCDEPEILRYKNIKSVPWVLTSDTLLYAGFTPDDRDYIRGQFNNCRNPCFNISQRSLKAIEGQSRQARFVA